MTCSTRQGAAAGTGALGCAALGERQAERSRGPWGSWKPSARRSLRVASRHAARLALMLVSLAAAPGASLADATLADARFERGRALMAEGRFAEARDELEASHRAEPATGTLLNLAVCNEALGKTATARAQFLAAEAASKFDGRSDRVALAREHLAKLTPLLAYVTLVVPEASRRPDLEVRLDGRVVEASGWNVLTAIDPGEHTIVARASGSIERSFAVSVAPASAQTVRIESSPTGPEVQASAATSARDDAPGAASPMRTLAWTLGGVGVASMGTGLFFGARAFSQWDERNRHCPDDVCSGDGRRAQRSAERAALYANLTMGAGLVALATGVGLFWLSSDEEAAPEPGAWRWAPRLGADGSVGVVTEGSW